MYDTSDAAETEASLITLANRLITEHDYTLDELYDLIDRAVHDPYQTDPPGDSYEAYSTLAGVLDDMLGDTDHDDATYHMLMAQRDELEALIAAVEADDDNDDDLYDRYGQPR